MLKKRILTALVGIPAAVYIIYFGKWLFAAAVFLLAAIAWHEFSSMLKKNGVTTCYAMGLAGITLFLVCGWSGNTELFFAAAMFLIIFVLIKTVTSHSAFTMTDVAFTVMGALYIGLPFSCMLLLRFVGQNECFFASHGYLVSPGTFYLALAFVLTWASDTFAYFVGIKFGKHKLCPAVSPAKTWEGAFGGLLGSLLAATFIGGAGLPLYPALILGLLVGIFAPFGDLVESALKRFCSVKDSGGIFPGHGGVLDRFDAVMFAVPVVYFYMHIFLR